MAMGGNGTVHEVLEATVRARGDDPALHEKRGGRWVATSWRDYQRDARRVARALMTFGVEGGTGVAILAKNSPTWLIANAGAIMAGGMPAGIYTTNSPEQVAYITRHCDAPVAFADTPEQVAKFVACAAQMPKLKAVVQMIGAPADARQGSLEILSFDALLQRASATTEEALEARVRGQKPSDVCTLIYTSGTTGEPKAVMMTHTNLVWTAHATALANGATRAERVVSYLPLSHIAEQILTIHTPMNVGAPVWFAESLEKLPETLVEVRPTLFLGVPRVWEKIQAKMVAAGAKASPVQKRIARWARRIGLAAGQAEQQGRRKPLAYPLAKRLVFDKVRRRLGLDAARLCVTSAAPIARDTLDFFLSFGIPLMEVYGMSECAGPATLSTPNRYRTGKCGTTIAGTEVKIADDGEICMRGPHVFKGYLKDPDATRAAIDEDGWLHSGDIGAFDVDGFLQITDRKKDLLITAGGENIAPQMIEGQLKSIPVVAQAVVIGDRRKFLAALVTLDAERVAAEAALAKSEAKTVEQASRCPVFHEHLKRQIDAINEKLARVQTIKKFTIVASDFSIEGGELTPTMKVRRKVVNEKYKAAIETMYAE